MERNRAVPARRWPPMVLSLLSFAVLMAFVVGVPVALTWDGETPMPHGGLHGLRMLLSSRQGFDAQIVTTWLVHGALALAWLTWAWLVICVVIELRSRATGRTPTRLPGSRTMQAMAACLVGTSLALMSAGRLLPTPAPASASGATAASAPGSSDSPGLLSLRVIDDYGFGSGQSPKDGPLASVVRFPFGSPEEPMPSSTPPNGHSIRTPMGEGIVATLPSPAAPGPSESEQSPAAPNPSPAPVPAPVRTHTVTARETLWSIAETELGSARRWRELATLNYSVRQNDGRMLSDDHWIAPGWTLILPSASAIAQKAELGYRPSNSANRAPVVPAVRPAPTGSASPVRWRSSPMPLTGPDPHRGSGSDPESREYAGGVELVAADMALRSPADQGTGAEHDAEAPIALLGAGLVGAGVVRLLDRMRRTQQRRRVTGGLIKLPDQERSALERRLRSGNGERTVRAIDLSLKLFARGCAGSRGPRGMTPLVRGVEVHPDAIELMLEEAMDHNAVPDPFGIRAGRPSVFVTMADLDEVTSGAYPGIGRVHSPFPTLVTLGTGADGPRLVNIEAIGSLALVGERGACEGVVRALALELATSHWAGQFELVLVGFGDELARFDRVRTVTDAGALLHQLHYRRLNGEMLLQSSSFGSFAHARIHEDADTWDPLVVVCGPNEEIDDFSELISVASDPRTGTAVIAPGTGHAASHIWDIARGELSTSLDLFGSFVLPQSISPNELTDVGALVATAADCESVNATAHPYGTMSVPMPRQLARCSAPDASDLLKIDDETASVGHGGIRSEPEAEAGRGSPEVVPGSERADRVTNGEAEEAAEADVEKSAEVEVAILGPVEVRGAEHQFTRAWAKELVVYLAMHPNGASNDAWATALWPDRLMAPSSLHSTASVARRSLGHARAGHDHLPRAHGRLRLAESVGTDWDRFVRLTESNGTTQWRTALDLVRGRPFDGLRASDWPILEGIAPAIEAAVVDVAGRLAGLYLQQGDAAGAEWAARKGLVVSPYDERLYRMLLRAADRAGNPAGVESVMSELIRLVADEVEPFDSIHPSTMELYRSLSRRKKLATAAL